MSKNIKNIIFDLGGVIINIDFNLSINAFIKLGIKDFNNIFSKAKQNNFFDKLDTGNISQQEFYNYLFDFLPSNVSEKDIDSAWNAMLQDFPKQRIELLKSLSKNYKLFLLSNTNIFHFPICNKQFEEQFNIKLSSLFYKVYYSHLIGKRKPDIKTFEFIIEDSNLIPEETFFIDDSIQHILSAKKLGIKVHHLLDEEDICDLFDNNNRLVNFK